ncbi:MAG: hypothetical protein K0Q51_1362 [Rickettsiaceae bacterium]|jgi:hypothetical protein|nr:hypothetical protein [Rickettsiaceae bacterium]
MRKHKSIKDDIARDDDEDARLFAANLSLAIRSSRN